MEFKTLFKYRNIWMGFAALWIVFYHTRFSCSAVPIDIFKRLGACGVDIFLFASGIGCYFSYYRSSNYEQFLMRRLKRILPVFYTFMAVWIPFKIINSNITLLQIFGNLTFVGYLLNMYNQFNWYMGVVWLYYLMCPFICMILNRPSKICKAAAVIFLALFLTCFYGENSPVIFASRIPIFILGCYFAHLSKTKNRIKVKYIALSFAAMATGIAGAVYSIFYLRDLLFTTGIYWYLLFFVAPGLCILISLTADRLERSKLLSVINRTFSKFGEMSFEIYLVHIMAYDILDDITEFTFKAWLICLPFIFIFSFLLLQTVKLIENQMKKLLSSSFIKKFN